jgi:hypothetical protein
MTSDIPAHPAPAPQVIGMKINSIPFTVLCKGYRVFATTANNIPELKCRITEALAIVTRDVKAKV